MGAFSRNLEDSTKEGLLVLPKCKTMHILHVCIYDREVCMFDRVTSHS